MNRECYLMVFFVVPWSFISIMKLYGILLSRVVDNKSFSKNISSREITYHDQISNQPNLLVLPPSFPYGGMENHRMVFLTLSVIKGDASERTNWKTRNGRWQMLRTKLMFLRDSKMENAMDDLPRVVHRYC
ncbi:hypothetical protein QYF36_005951 [Acer negundo]|nr:hypothetical protein QYF36_005951 [Acer negundo]